MLKKFFVALKEEGFKSVFNKIYYKLKKLRDKKYSYNAPKITKEIIQEIDNFSFKPLVSIVMPVYNVDIQWLDKAIESIKKQWYTNWELCIVDDCSSSIDLQKYLKKISDRKIKIKFLSKNVNISTASNKALEMAEGEYIGLIDHDDELTVDALYEVVKVLNMTDTEFIYSDEDKVDSKGMYIEPHFKPDYMPDTFFSQNYISHFSVIKKSLIDQVNGFTVGLEGAQDYDLYLKILEHTNKVFHIPKILYHWRRIPGSTALKFKSKKDVQKKGKQALESAMKRRKIVASILDGKCDGTYKIQYKLQKTPLVSIIIPFRDKSNLLMMCIKSILEKSTYGNFEIIAINNNSKEKKTFKTIEQLKKLDKRILFIDYNDIFNYSKINNFAIKSYAKGEHIILLNNDIEIITHNWIEEMLVYSQQEEIGVVGGKLYYPNDKIQHAGIIVGIGGVAGHAHKYFPRYHQGYFCRLNIVQNISAVTGACCMMKRRLFNSINGFNEKELQVALNDVDLCLRVQEKGFRNIFTPYCEAYHYESVSRGQEDTLKKKKRYSDEIKYIKQEHYKFYENGDPCYNINLTIEKENFEIR